MFFTREVKTLCHTVNKASVKRGEKEGLGVFYCDVGLTVASLPSKFLQTSSTPSTKSFVSCVVLDFVDLVILFFVKEE